MSEPCLLTEEEFARLDALTDEQRSRIPEGARLAHEHAKKTGNRLGKPEAAPKRGRK